MAPPTKMQFLQRSRSSLPRRFAPNDSDPVFAGFSTQDGPMGSAPHRAVKNSHRHSGVHAMRLISVMQRASPESDSSPQLGKQLRMFVQQLEQQPG